MHRSSGDIWSVTHSSLVTPAQSVALLFKVAVWTLSCCSFKHEAAQEVGLLHYYTRARNMDQCHQTTYAWSSAWAVGDETTSQAVFCVVVVSRTCSASTKLNFEFFCGTLVCIIAICYLATVESICNIRRRSTNIFATIYHFLTVLRQDLLGP